MHPLTDSDTKESVKLVKEYLEGRYRFGRQDIHHLLEIENEVQVKDIDSIVKLNVSAKRSNDWPELPNIKEKLKKKTVIYYKASESKSREETSQPKQSVPNN